MKSRPKSARKTPIDFLETINQFHATNDKTDAVLYYLDPFQELFRTTI